MEQLSDLLLKFGIHLLLAATYFHKVIKDNSIEKFKKEVVKEINDKLRNQTELLEGIVKSNCSVINKSYSKVYEVKNETGIIHEIVKKVDERTVEIYASNKRNNHDR